MPGLKTPSVPAVQRTLAIIEHLAQSRPGLGTSELSRLLELPKSSVHCLLLTLERCGYVYRSSRTGRYVLGLKLFSLAHSAPGSSRLRDQVTPFLRGLMERTRLTVHLAVLDRSEVVLVEKVAPAAAARLATWVGKRMDVHCTAIGKALAAALSEEELIEVVRQRPLVRHNDNTIVSMKHLKEELARVRKQGYSLDDEEEEVGLRCVGVPVLDRDGKTIAAISVSGTTSDVTAENLSSLVQQVRETAAAIMPALPPDMGPGI